MKAQTAEPDARDYVEQPTDVVPLGAAPGTRFTYANGSRPLSGYTIKRGIGRGGFGEVYYAVSDGGKEVALKLLRRNFDIELRGVAQCLNLKHPHLLGLYDIRTDDGGDHWVVMEYVTGPSLDEIIAANPNGLPPVEAVAWLAGVAAGVGYLHQSGIVHRDLKPGNIFSDAGLVKIGDYGLAKFISCSRRSGQTESVGTVHYMAPEIAQGRYGKEIDVYALGIILYEMLTGQLPFEGESMAEVLMKHLTAEPDLAPLAEPFRSVVGRALAKDPQARFGSVEKMMAALPLAPHAGPAVIIPRHVPTAAAKSIPAVEATLNNSKPQEPIQRWVRDTLSGFGSAWQSQFNTPAKVVLILIGLWLVAVIGPVVAPVVVPLSVLTAIAYGAYFAIWSFNRGGRGMAIAGTNTAGQSPPARQGTAGVRQATGGVQQPPPTRQQTPAAGRFVPPGRRPWNPRAMPALIVEPIRKRLADLCGSLVLSAVVVLVTTIVMFLVRGESATPEQFAWLSLVSIAGAWGVLVPAKFWEGTRGEPALRRFTMLVVGLLVGAAAWGVQKSLFVSLPHEFTAQPAFSKVALAIGTAGSYGPHSLMAFLTYFGFLFLLVRWWRLADPLRGSRLSLWATAVCVSCAIGLYLFWPFAQKWEYFPQPWGFLVAANIAIAVQLASPWVGRRRLSAALPLLLTVIGLTAVAGHAEEKTAHDKQSPSHDQDKAEPAASAPEWTKWPAGVPRIKDQMTEIMVHAGPYATRTECERYLVHELATAVEQYIQTEIAHVAGYHVSVPQDLIERLSNDRFLSTEHKALSKLADDQEMFESFALLKFDQEAKDRLRILWQQAVARQRVRTAGTWLAIALVVLSAGWFVLRRGAGKSAPAPAANRSANVHA